MLDIDKSVTGGRRTAHEYARDLLRAAILRGSIVGGTRLVQADLATELGVSTTPVREALRDLASEGLVHLDAHRGAIVRKLDYDELIEVYDMTKILEPHAARLAAEKPDHEGLNRAEKIADEMESELDVGVWVDLNRHFHEALVSGVENKRLLRLLQSLRDAVAPYVGLALQKQDYRFQRANRHHRQLLAAIRSGDPDRAATVSSDHVDLTVRDIGKARHLFEENGAA